MTESRFIPHYKANSMLLALLLMAPAVFAQQPVPAEPADNPTGAQQPQAVVPPTGQEPPAQADSIDYWLGKLSDAVSNLEYSGLVTFEHQGLLETLQVFHAVRDGEQVERVRYLSGEPRELISHGTTSACNRVVSPFGRASQWTSIDGQRAGSYHFVLRGGERIADRDTVVIEARPRDQHRLGVLLNLDRETGLPLKSMLVGAQGKVLERYQFVQLDLSPISDANLQPGSPNTRRIDNRHACESAQTRWQLGWLPDGYQRVAVRTLADGDMLVFSDGLSVFTVFVQRLGPELEYKGRAIRGATVAYMDRVEVDGTNYTVTVVGEIPDATAQRLARSVAMEAGS
ncbi:MucB/RseB C-terminal domain-containing protein [Microbulbifer sp. JSM ZJ756]|uniref:MucB/RseB C-terminal domain-containing protein n=1 Tax=Microbulbifer sp. JSM ZJ756 TaxID=3376191 RepID=UPI00379F18E7